MQSINGPVHSSVYAIELSSRLTRSIHLKLAFFALSFFIVVSLYQAFLSCLPASCGWCLPCGIAMRWIDEVECRVCRRRTLVDSSISSSSSSSDAGHFLHATYMALDPSLDG